MKKFKRKAITTNEEPLSGPGWAAYIEAPEGFDFEAWAEENDNFHANRSFGQKVRHFLSYSLFYFKYKVLRFRSDDVIQDLDEEFGADEEFLITFGRGMEILDEIGIQILEFAEQLIDKDRAEIEYRSKRIVFYQKDHPTNSGYARYIEDLDGSNKFEYGWGHESGTRQQIIESISLHVGYECAQIEMGAL